MHFNKLIVFLIFSPCSFKDLIFFVTDMGVNCSGCICAGKDAEFHSEIEFNLPKANKKQHQNSELSFPFPEETIQYTRKIIVIQSYWRGHLARKNYQLIRRKKKKTVSSYFTFEDSRETKSSNNMIERDERPAYTYKSGAVYMGQ